jgi:hypothetical protein
MGAEPAGKSSQFVDGMSAGKILVSAMVALTVLRVVLVCFEEPSPAEAYYFLCAKKPAAAYFDGPAGTAWLTGRIHGLSGSDLLWRLQAPLWSLAATAACYLLLRGLGEGNSAAWTALALNALPVFNMAALRVGPVLPALTFSLLALYLAWRAYEAERWRILWWLAAGVAIGVACCLAYAAAALVPALVIFTLCSPRHRSGEHITGLAIFVLAPLLMLSPALAWNASLEWIPIAGGTLRSLWNFEFTGFFLSIVQMMGGFSPLIFLMMLVAWFALWGESRTHLRTRFLFLDAMPGVVLTLYFALRGHEAEFFLLLAAPLLIPRVLSLFSSRLLKQAAFGLAIIFSAYGMFNVFQTGSGWGRTAETVKQLFLEKSGAGDEGLFLIAGDASLASVLGYHLRDDLIPPAGHPAVYVRESQDISNQFGLWPSYADFVEAIEPKDEYFTEQKGENPFMGRSALYITHESANDVPQTIKAAFESVSYLQQMPPVGGGTEPLYIYVCRNYQTMPL